MGVDGSRCDPPEIAESEGSSRGAPSETVALCVPVRRRRGRPRRIARTTERPSDAIAPVSGVALELGRTLALPIFWHNRGENLAQLTAGVLATRLSTHSDRAAHTIATRVRGLSALHPLMHTLDAAAELGRRSSGVDIDDGTLRLVREHFLGTDPARVSLAALAERYGLHFETSPRHWSAPQPPSPSRSGV